MVKGAIESSLDDVLHINSSTYNLAYQRWTRKMHGKKFQSARPELIEVKCLNFNGCLCCFVVLVLCLRCVCVVLFCILRNATPMFSIPCKLAITKQADLMFVCVTIQFNTYEPCMCQRLLRFVFMRHVLDP